MTKALRAAGSDATIMTSLRASTFPSTPIDWRGWCLRQKVADRGGHVGAAQHGAQGDEIEVGPPLVGLGTVAELQGFRVSAPVGAAEAFALLESCGAMGLWRREAQPPFRALTSASASAESHLTAPAAAPISQPSLSINIVTGRPRALPPLRMVSKASPLGSA